ncbi:hypothetical protein HAX54_000011 [Datura stramonium]|uniref:Uncharacterized protein n=1 Tax=Datura stramonium TaxID=4076 RepID=A0ABS8RFJ8_DATST|nr:hypothetical protein [Datura stramonium]
MVPIVLKAWTDVPKWFSLAIEGDYKPHNSYATYYKCGWKSPTATDTQVDLSWQLILQRIWENLVHGEKGNDVKNTEVADDLEKGAQSCENSKVFPSLPVAINWLRDTVRKNRSGRSQVLVTGLYIS